MSQLPTYVSSGPAGGSPLVLLHGIGSTALGWQSQLNSFPGRRTLAWNAPGFADSPPLYSVQPMTTEYARSLLALLDSLGIERAALIASSWGATIAVALAQLEPSRVTHLVLSGPTAGYGSYPEPQRAQLLAARSARAHSIGVGVMLEQDAPRLVAGVMTQAVRSQLEQSRQGIALGAYLQALHALTEVDTERDIRHVTCPTLIVYGEQDEVAPPASHAKRLAHAVPKAPLHSISGCGHLPHVEKPERFASLVNDFLAT